MLSTRTSNSLSQAQASTDHPIFNLAISWVLMIPLIYFAGVGGFWFQHEANNNPLSQRYSSLVSDSHSTTTTLINVSVLTLVLIPVALNTKPIINLCTKDKIFPALVFFALASCLWSQFPTSSFKSSCFLAVETLLAFYLYHRFTPKQLFSLLFMLGWLCLGLSLVLIFFFPKYGIDTSGSSIGGWQGMYGQKNTCSMVTFFLMLTAVFAPTTTASGRFYRAAFIALSILMILMTQSATGKVLLACLLAYFVCMKVVQKFSAKDRTLVMILITLVLAPLTVVAISYWTEILLLLGRDPSLTGRTELWQGAMISVMKRPILGYGYVAFWTGFQGEAANVSLANHWSSVYAHSGFLNMLTTLGAAGLGLFCYTLLRAFRDAGSCLKSRDLSFMSWSLCIIISTLVLNVDEVTIMLPDHLLWILYMLACICLSEGANSNRLRMEHG